jgi:hypothetical protein
MRGSPRGSVPLDSAQGVRRGLRNPAVFFLPAGDWALLARRVIRQSLVAGCLTNGRQVLVSSPE